MTIIIRPVTKDDTEALFALRLNALKTNPEAFGSSYEDNVARWTAESYGASRIADADSDDVIFCAELSGELVGMMGFLRNKALKTKHTAIIWGVYVKPDARRLGIGKKLLQATLDHAHNCDGLALITLTVITENEAAIALYEKMGLVAWGTQPDALRVGNKSYDELWMSYRIE